MALFTADLLLINFVNGSPMDTRLTDVEIRLTHQEAALDEMNQVLLKQHQLIEALRHDLKTLQRQLRPRAGCRRAIPAWSSSPTERSRNSILA